MGQPLFSLLRPAYENTPELASLASQMRADRESSGNLERQIEFDDIVARELSSLSLSGLQINELRTLLSPSGLEMESKNLSDTMNPQETDRQLRPSQAGIQPLDSDEEDDGEESPRRARPRTILLAVGVG